MARSTVLRGRSFSPNAAPSMVARRAMPKLLSDIGFRRGSDSRCRPGLEWRQKRRGRIAGLLLSPCHRVVPVAWPGFGGLSRDFDGGLSLSRRSSRRDRGFGDGRCAGGSASGNPNHLLLLFERLRPAACASAGQIRKPLCRLELQRFRRRLSGNPGQDRKRREKLQEKNHDQDRGRIERKPAQHAVSERRIRRQIIGRPCKFLFPLSLRNVGRANKLQRNKRDKPQSHVLARWSLSDRANYADPRSQARRRSKGAQATMLETKRDRRMQS